MSQFYADIRGARGPASRTGTAASGMRGHIRGWHVGAEVACFAENGIDKCRIYLTGGSSGDRRGSGRNHLLTIGEDETVEAVSERMWRGRRYVTIRIKEEL